MEPSRKDRVVLGGGLPFESGGRLFCRMDWLPIKRLAAYASEQLDDCALGSAPVGQRKKVVLAHEQRNVLRAGMFNC